MEVVITPDADAAAQLVADVLIGALAAELADYYREAYEHKPDWQDL